MFLGFADVEAAFLMCSGAYPHFSCDTPLAARFLILLWIFA